MPTSRKTSRSRPLNVSVSSRTHNLKVSVSSRSRQSVGRSRSRSPLGLKIKRLGLGPQGLVYIPGISSNNASKVKECMRNLKFTGVNSGGEADDV